AVDSSDATTSLAGLVDGGLVFASVAHTGAVCLRRSNPARSLVSGHGLVVVACGDHTSGPHSGRILLCTVIAQDLSRAGCDLGIVLTSCHLCSYWGGCAAAACVAAMSLSACALIACGPSD